MMSKPRQWIAAMWQLTFARYIVVGVANTAFGYGVYALALLGGASYPIASLISLAAGIVVSFRTQGNFVFKNSSTSLFGRYVVAWLVIYSVNVGIIGLFVRLHLGELLAGALALPFNVVLGFIVQRYFVFGPSGRSGNRNPSK